MDLQKNSFIEPAEICAYWLKRLGHLVQKYRITIQKTFFQICFQARLWMFIQIWE